MTIEEGAGKTASESHWCGLCKDDGGGASSALTTATALRKGFTSSPASGALAALEMRHREAEHTAIPGDGLGIYLHQQKPVPSRPGK